MDIFCQQCAAAPGWPFDLSKVFKHSCQRCFQYKPCNDYAWKTGRQPVEAAPNQNQAAPIRINPNAQCELPKATSADKALAALNAINPEPKGIKLETKKK